jgi:predicted alpha/beta hydrolase family esterase
MKITVLFIHSAGPQSQYEGSESLVAYLQRSLGEEYDVLYPRMPEPENPRYEQWKDQLQMEISGLKKHVILVGHSLGASVLIKYLSETVDKKPVAGLFLVAAPFWGGEDWEIDEFTLKNNFPSKIADIPAVFMYHSRDDHWVPFKHLLLYAEKFPDITIRMLEGEQHEFYDGLPELVADIKEISQKFNKHKLNP